MELGIPGYQFIASVVKLQKLLAVLVEVVPPAQAVIPEIVPRNLLNTPLKWVLG